MHIRLIAVGERQPAWVEEAVSTYTDRFPLPWKFRIDRIRTARRSGRGAVRNAVNTESDRILGKITPRENVILLDEKGTQMNSQELAIRLAGWQESGRDQCFVIGGPDGVSAECRRRADVTWSLSQLTLPHGIARVLFAEQLYRAWSLQTGHPYHRD